MDFEILLQIFISSVAATSAMTVFSYMVSASARELYKEPVLLTYLLTVTKIEISPKLKAITAWLIHYLIGLTFVIIYHYLWKYNVANLSWQTSIILGALSGLIGIFAWMIMFAASPKKPAIDFKGYYIQLFFAHVIFGVVAFWVYSELY
jgi:hypothetical protein